jgi:hypothetical protein
LGQPAVSGQQEERESALGVIYLPKKSKNTTYYPKTKKKTANKQQNRMLRHFFTKSNNFRETNPKKEHFEPICYQEK